MKKQGQAGWIGQDAKGIVDVYENNKPAYTCHLILFVSVDGSLRFYMLYFLLSKPPSVCPSGRRVGRQASIDRME